MCWIFVRTERSLLLPEDFAVVSFGEMIFFFLRQLVSAEGSNVSDGASQCTDSMARNEAKHDRVDHATPGHGNGGNAPLSHDDTLTETESIMSGRRGHRLHKGSRHRSERYERYDGYNGKLDTRCVCRTLIFFFYGRLYYFTLVRFVKPF